MEDLHEPDEPEDGVEPESLPTAEEIVSSSIRSGALSDICDITVTMRDVDTEEDDLVKTFVERGCGCDVGPKKSPCSRLFPADHFLSVRGAMAEMTHDELDMFIMGQIMASCFQSSILQGHHSTSPTERKITSSLFYHHGQRVCQRTFLFLHNIGIKRYKNLKKSYITNGPAVRVHGNKGKMPKHHLSLDQIKDVIQYILNYTGL